MGRVRTSGAGVLLLIALQCLASAACIGLLWVRMHRTGSDELSFLGWNLFLAWVPMLFAFLTYLLHRMQTSVLVVAAPTAAWLLFLPNAPYIATDMLHLGNTWEHVPLWYDVVLLTTFGGTGLLIGYSSLFLIHTVATERLGPVLSWTGTLAVILLSVVGVYMGRFLRLNSWDVVAHPDALLNAVLHSRLADPAGHPAFVTLALAVTLVLAVGYLLFVGVAISLQRRATGEPSRA
jgi:uncharacterized membrane protein